MNSKLKNIPKEFLINYEKENNDTDFYIMSSETKSIQKNDTIWLLLVFLILLDI